MHAGFSGYLKHVDFFIDFVQLLFAPTTIEFNIFCWNFAHVSYLPISTKGCSRFFFILFKHWVICKNQKRPGYCILTFYNFIDNSKFL